MFICLKAFLISCLFSFTAYGEKQNTSLELLERVAVENAPELEELDHVQKSYEASSIAAEQLPDPTLQIGAINIPTDTFDFTQENMTQLKFGIVQKFPRGSSLGINSEQQHILAKKTRYNHELTKEELLRQLRHDWLDLYYLLKAKTIAQQTTVVFKHLVRVTTSTLSAGKGNQHDVLRAQLELSQLENRLIAIEESIQKVRANLARWVGYKLAQHAYPKSLPNWETPKTPQLLQKNVKYHPLLLASDKSVHAAKKDIELSKSNYFPAWSAGVNYSVRKGRSGMNRKRRADFVGVQISTELPLFPGNRQDKKLTASIERYAAAKSKRKQIFLNLYKEIARVYATWKQLSAQNKLYRATLLPQAKMYAEATLNAYENTQVDFPTVARAYEKELNTSLKATQVLMNLYKARANLLYLEATSEG